MKTKLHNYIERNEEYHCQCERGGTIYLGLHWAKYVNMSLFLVLIGSNLWILLNPEDNGLVSILFVDALGIFACVFGYIQMYRDMRKNGHSKKCSNSAALIGLKYSAKGSSYEIYPPHTKR